jgi:NADPH2:quinone reductase
MLAVLRDRKTDRRLRRATTSPTGANGDVDDRSAIGERRPSRWRSRRWPLRETWTSREKLGLACYQSPMKAALYRVQGPPEALSYEEAPDPHPGSGELLMHIEAISVEGGDTLNRRSVAPGERPKILGYAAAGEVIALGDGVRGFAVGQKVTTFAPSGSHAELRAAPAATSWIVPDGLDMRIAAAIPCGPGTAALALKLGGLRAGETVLIQGAAGGVGAAVVQLASQAGARVLGTATSAVALDVLRGLGLAEPILIGERTVDEETRERLGGAGVDLLVDCVGGSALDDGLLALKDGGRAVLVGLVGGLRHQVDTGQLVGRRLRLIGCLLGAVMHETPVRRMIAGLLQSAAEGRLTVPIDAEFPLSQAAAAHARAEVRGRLGRVVMVPDRWTASARA